MSVTQRTISMVNIHEIPERSPSPMYTDRTIVFDLDGTLIDTAPDLTMALNHVLASEGRPPMPEAQVRGLVGQGALALITRGMAASGAPAAEDDLPRLLDLFLAYYGKNLAVHSVPFPGAVNMLALLAEHGARLAVCTNKPIGLAVPLFDALELTEYFSAILGGDSLPVRKPDPLHLLETITQAGGDRARAVMVGDSAPDVDAARAALIPSVAVTFGYTQTPVEELGADVLIDHFDRLGDVLHALFEHGIPQTSA